MSPAFSKADAPIERTLRRSNGRKPRAVLSGPGNAPRLVSMNARFPMLTLNVVTPLVGSGMSMKERAVQPLNAESPIVRVTRLWLPKTPLPT